MDIGGIEIGQQAATTAALSGAGGVGAVVAVMRGWRFIRKEFADAEGDKRQSDFNARTISRADYLEKQLDEMRTKLSEQAIALGIARGEAEAYKMQVKGISDSKDEWKTRAMESAKANAELDRAVTTLSAHLMQMRMQAASADGVGCDVTQTPPLSALAKERMAMDFKLVGGS